MIKKIPLHAEVLEAFRIFLQQPCYSIIPAFHYAIPVPRGASHLLPGNQGIMPHSNILFAMGAATRLRNSVRI
jgi:hypothetical protein